MLATHLAAAASHIGIGGAAVVVKETSRTATVRIVDASGRTVTQLQLSAHDSGWHVGSLTHCTVKEKG